MILHQVCIYTLGGILTRIKGLYYYSHDNERFPHGFSLENSDASKVVNVNEAWKANNYSKLGGNSACNWYLVFGYVA
jgi:hypothetical protein